MLSSDIVIKRASASVQKLPALPDVVMKLLSVVNSPYSSADDAAMLIEKDPALTGAVLRMANSSFYGVPRSISTVSAAIVILGFNAVRSIVLATAVFKAVPGNGGMGFDMGRFWKHSLAVSSACRIIAAKTTVPGAPDAETAFCAGILHDIGKLVLLNAFPDELMEAHDYAIEQHMPIHRAELEIIGINHTRVGRLISDKWALPQSLGQSIVYHHEPLAAESDHLFPLVVSFGDSFAHRAGITALCDEPEPYLAHSSIAELGLTDVSLEQCYDRFLVAVDKSADLISALGIAG